MLSAENKLMYFQIWFGVLNPSWNQNKALDTHLVQAKPSDITLDNG